MNEKKSLALPAGRVSVNDGGVFICAEFKALRPIMKSVGRLLGAMALLSQWTACGGNAQQFQTEEAPVESTKDVTMIQKLLTTHAAVGVARLQMLNQKLDPEWSFDWKQGACVFNDGRKIKAQFLGYIDGDLNWHWGSKYHAAPEEMRASVQKIQDFGREAGILQFISDSFKLDTDEEAGALALIATGLAGADGYVYKYDDGKSMMFLLFDTDMVDMSEMTSRDAMQAMNYVARFLAFHEIDDHKGSMKRFFEKAGRDMLETEQRIEVTFADEQRMGFDFDAMGRLASMSMMKPEEK